MAASPRAWPTAVKRVAQNEAAHRPPAAYYWSGDALRSRSVSDTVLWGTVDVPTPPARLLADWHRETSERIGLEAGDVEVLPLARARMRWSRVRWWCLIPASRTPSSRATAAAFVRQTFRPSQHSPRHS